MNTYSLEEAAVILCGPDENGGPLPGKVQWLRKRLLAGDVPGYKACRKWRMSEDHIAAAVKALEPRRFFVPEVPMMAGLTPTSRRRLAS